MLHSLNTKLCGAKIRKSLQNSLWTYDAHQFLNWHFQNAVSLYNHNFYSPPKVSQLEATIKKSDKWMNKKWKNKQINKQWKKQRPMHVYWSEVTEQSNKQINEWTTKRMNKIMDEWMNKKCQSKNGANNGANNQAKKLTEWTMEQATGQSMW